MIVLDANILVGAAIGRQIPRVLASAYARGVPLSVAEPQFIEAASVLINKIGLTERDTRTALVRIAAFVNPLSLEFYGAMETAARQRLHHGAQSDWPVLAAALASDGGIWTNDRDFFGVGVPIWSSRNMGYAS